MCLDTLFFVHSLNNVNLILSKNKLAYVHTNGVINFIKTIFLVLFFSFPIHRTRFVQKQASCLHNQCEKYFILISIQNTRPSTLRNLLLTYHNAIEIHRYQQIKIIRVQMPASLILYYTVPLHFDDLKCAPINYLNTDKLYTTSCFCYY